MENRWIAGQQNRVTFVMIDATGTEVAGIGDGNLVIEISENGAAFAGAIGTDTEIGNGWYTYLSDAAEGATIGDTISIRVNGAGAIQQNLEYVVLQRTPLAEDITYTITNSVSLLPIEGVVTSISTDLAGNNIIWRGRTDSFGIAQDIINGQVPYLDFGTYYFWNRLSGFVFSNPDTEIFTAADTTGETTGTPITAGAGTGLSIAQPLKYTLLSLPYYAQIMGVNPVHFQGGFGETVWPATAACGGIWPRYSWQNGDQVSKEDLVRAIYDAEYDIAQVLGYWPAPRWIDKEVHQYPRPYRRDAYGFGLNARWQSKSIETKYAKIIEAGQRAVTLIDTATVAGGSLAYTDEDGDGFNETATITMATSLTDACEINVYFTDENGEQEWEIRPARSKTITGGNFIAVFDSWLFIDPDLQSVYPTVDEPKFIGIDITTVANYVASVDVYREFTDNTAQSAEFFWENKPNVIGIVGICSSCGGSGCEACTLTTQDGCVHIRDVDRGVVVPTPATYSEDDAAWSSDCWTECREPDQVKIWYYAGDLDNRYLRGSTCNELKNELAQAIAWMATARLERPLCACNNVQSLSMDLQRNMIFTPPDGGSFFINDEILNNPFGTKKGEVMAWRRISKLVELVPDVALV